MKRILTLLLLCAVLHSNAQSPFTPGNLVVARIGDGSTGTYSATTTYYPVALLEYTPTGTLVQTISLASATSGSQLTVTGNNQEVSLNLSSNKAYLSLQGYDQSASTTAAINTSTKVVGLVGVNGVADYTTKILAGAATIRQVTSVDGSAFWCAGSATGVTYLPYGHSSSTAATNVSTSTTNVKAVDIFDNQLYGMGFNGNVPSLYSVGTGLPTTTATNALLAGLPTGSSSTNNGFVFFDVGNTGTPNLLYTIDGINLRKYTYSATAFNYISGFTVTAAGSGYTSVPTISFTGGGGSGLAATAVTTSNAVSAIYSTVSGSGYTSAPTVSFTGGGGTGATATATLASAAGWVYNGSVGIGAVSAITVGSGGAGYTSAPTVSISGGGGSGAAATATISGGAVTGFTIINCGSGYTSAPTVTLSGGGFTTAATTLTAVLPGNIAVGITGTLVSSKAQLYITLVQSTGTTSTSTNALLSVADANSSGAAPSTTTTILAKSGSNYIYRGVAFAPNPNFATWTGTTNTNWNTGTNWLSGTVPSTATSAFIPTVSSGNYPVLPASLTTGGITVQTGATLSTNTTTAVTGNITVSSGGTFTIGNATTITGILTNSGTTTVNAATTVSGNITNSGSLTVNAAITGGITNSGTTTVSTATTITGNVATTIGTTTVNAATTITGNFTVSGTASTSINAATTVTGTFTAGGTGTSGSSTSINANTTVNVGVIFVSTAANTATISIASGMALTTQGNVGANSSGAGGATAGTFTGAGKVVMSNSSKCTFGCSFNNLDVNNTGSVAWGVSGTPTINGFFNLIAGQLNVATLTLGSSASAQFGPTSALGTLSGTIAFAGRPVTFKSDATGTAKFVTGITGSLTGATNVTVERYIPSNNRKAFVMVGSPVTSTIQAAWQEDDTAISGYGTHITGGVSQGVNGFDGPATSANSIFTYNDDNATGSKWTPLANTTATAGLAPGKGYLIYVRGDRSENRPVTGNSSNTVLRATGILGSNSGSISGGTTALTAGTAMTSFLKTAASEYSLIANPLLGLLYWDTLTKDPTNFQHLSTTFTVYDPNLGVFVTSNGTTLTPYSGSGTTQQNPAYLQSGQAFFVQNDASGTAPTLNILECHRGNSFSAITNTVFGVAAPTQKLQQLNINTYHAANNQFADGAVALFGSNYKADVDNADINKFTNFKETFGLVRNNKILGLEARPLVTSNDTLYCNLSNYGKSGYTFVIDGSNFTNTTAMLEDKYTATKQPIDLVGKTTYDFVINDDAASAAKDRFIITFGSTTPVSTATGANSSFVKMGPNPVSNELMVSFKNAAADNTIIKVVNSLGQLVKTVNAGNTATGNISIALGNLSSGMYTVQLLSGGKQISTQKIVKQ